MIGWISTTCAILMGILLIIIVLPDGQRGRLWWALSLGPIAGLSISSSVLFVLMVLADAQPVWVLLLDGLISTAAVVVIVLTRVETIRSVISESLRDLSCVQGSLLWVLIAALLIATGQTLATAWTYQQIRPHGWWDAIMIWNVRAKFFTSSSFGLIHTFDLDPIAHGDYPLMLPLSVSRIWGLNGVDGSFDPFVLQVALVLPMILLVVTAIASRSGLAWGLLGGLALLSSRDLGEQLSWQIADIPLAYVLASTLAILMEANALQIGVTARNRWMMLAGLMSASAAWMKNEGLVAFGLTALMIISTPLLRGKFNSVAIDMAAFLKGSGIILLAIVLFKLAYAPESDLLAERSASMLELMSDPERHSLIWEGATFIAREQWLIPVLGLMGLTIGALVMGLRYRASQLLLGITFIAGLSMSYYLAYLTTPHEIKWHLSTSIHRLAIHLWPLVVLTAMPCGASWITAVDPSVESASSPRPQSASAGTG